MRKRVIRFFKHKTLWLTIYWLLFTIIFLTTFVEEIENSDIELTIFPETYFNEKIFFPLNYSIGILIFLAVYSPPILGLFYGKFITFEKKYTAKYVGFWSRSLKSILNSILLFFGFYFSIFLGSFYLLVNGILYFKTGQTILDSLFGVKLVDSITGETPSKKQLLKRLLAKILSYLTLSFGYLVAAFMPEKQALHDTISGTRFIKIQSIKKNQSEGIHISYKWIFFWIPLFLVPIILLIASVVFYI